MNAPVQGIHAAPQRRTLRTTTIVQFLTLAAIWGSTWIVIKGQLGSVPVAWSVSYRFLIAAAVMAVLSVVVGRQLRLSAVGHALALLVGTLQFALNFNLVYEAERHVTSGLVALIFALIVVPNTLLARAFLGQRIAPAFVIGSIVGIAGVALLVGGDLGGQGNAPLGIGLGVVAVLCASAGNVLQGTERARVLPLEPLLAFTMLYGGLLAGAVAWMADGPPPPAPSIGYAGGLAYLAIIASALAFRLYYSLIREIGPARASYVNVVVPVIAMALSTVFETYVWTWGSAAGALLALVGLVIALRSRA